MVRALVAVGPGLGGGSEGPLLPHIPAQVYVTCR